MGLPPHPTLWGSISHPIPSPPPALQVHPLPHRGSQALLFTFQMGNKPQPSLCTPKKPQPKTRGEK